MKKGIHPTYHSEARVTCACGNEMVMGSTKETLEVDTCSNCHPFYTGTERGAVKGGRVEKFRSRMEKKDALAVDKTPKKARVKSAKSSK